MRFQGQVLPQKRGKFWPEKGSPQSCEPNVHENAPRRVKSAHDVATRTYTARENVALR